MDALVELVFSAAKEVEQPPLQSANGAQALKADTGGDESVFEFTSTADLQAKRGAILAGLGVKYGCNLMKQSRATYWSEDGNVRAVVSLSKRYEKPAGRPYWYAYHPDWDDFLDSASAAVFVLGMMDKKEAFAIPVDEIRAILPKLNTSNPPSGKTYWHIHLHEDASGALRLYVPGGPHLVLTPFAVDVK